MIWVAVYLAIGAVLSWPFYKLTFGANWKLIPVCMVLWLPFIIWVAGSALIGLVRGK